MRRSAKRARDQSRPEEESGAITARVRSVGAVLTQDTDPASQDR